jgi:hypothetical protein
MQCYGATRDRHVDRSTHLTKSTLADDLDCSEVIQAQSRPPKSKESGFLPSQLLQLAIFPFFRYHYMALKLSFELNAPMNLSEPSSKTTSVSQRTWYSAQ